MRVAVIGAVFATVVLAGCLGTGGAGTDPVVTDTPGTATSETDVRELVPNHPSNLTADSVREFAVATERSYGAERLRTANTTDLTLTPVRSWVNESRDGFRIHLEMGVSHYQRVDGSRIVGDGYYTAVYFLNESTVLRATEGGQVRPGPDPRNGTGLRGSGGR